MSRVAGLVLCLALAGPVAAAGIPPEARRSGFDAMSPDIQAMQRDETANPGLLWLQDGADLWAASPAPERPSCTGCHGDARASMRGVAARYPAYDAAAGTAIDIQGRINACRTRHQGASPLAYESQELLGLVTYVAAQSRELPIAAPDDPRLAPARAAGRALFTRRMGQLGQSCAACHDDHPGQRLGAALIPQGHPTGYPLYRLEWQGVGSVQRRLRNCMTGMRAEPFAYGAPEFIALERYLMDRASPLPMETPAVRP